MSFFFNPGFLIFILMAGFAVLILYLIIYDQKKQGTMPAAFLGQLVEFGAYGSGETRDIDYSGHQIQADFHSGNDPQKRVFRLILPMDSSGWFLVEKEGITDSLLESTGLEGKIATPDASFDSRFRVSADDPGFASAYFASPKKREAVEGLFSEGCAFIELNKNGLCAVWPPLLAKDLTDAGFVKRSLAPLSALGEELPPVTLPPATEFGKEQFTRVMGGANALMLIVAVVSLFLPPGYSCGRIIDAYGMFCDCAPYIGFAVAGLVILSAVLLKGKSWFRFAIMAITFSSLIWFSGDGFLVEGYLNTSLDTGRPAMHLATILSKYQSNYRGVSYYLVVRSWRGRGTDDVKLKVFRDAYQNAQPGTIVAIETKPGRFGYEWVLGYRLQPPAPFPGK